MSGRRRKWEEEEMGGGMCAWVGKESSVPSQLLVTCGTNGVKEGVQKPGDKGEEGGG